MIRATKSCHVVSINAVPVTVECEASKGIGIHLVGLADAAVKESLLRITTALQATGYRIPGERIVVNLAPADLSKNGSGYDLPITLAIISATGQNVLTELDKWFIIGELGLDGSVRSVPGTVQTVICAKEAGAKGVIIPGTSARELERLDFQIPVYPVDLLEEAISVINDPDTAETIEEYIIRNGTANENQNETPSVWDAIEGHDKEKRGLEIAAAGGHNVLLVGDKGNGKETLAKSMLEILPPMTRKETIETAAVFSASSRLNTVGTRPFRSPHYSCSMSSMLGGGSGGDILPGEVSLAHNGILYIDDANLMPKGMQEALRGPLEEKQIKISRLKSVVTYPADFRLLAAMDQCPCGRHDTKGACTCTDNQRKLFLSKLSGPVYDRLAVQISVHGTMQRNGSAKAGQSAAETASRVQKALKIQRERYKDEPYSNNNGLDAKGIEKYCRMNEVLKDFLEKIMTKLGLSARCYSQTMRIARTIADLEGSEDIETKHVSEAVTYRFLDKTTE